MKHWIESCLTADKFQKACYILNGGTWTEGPMLAVDRSYAAISKAPLGLPSMRLMVTGGQNGGGKNNKTILTNLTL